MVQFIREQTRQYGSDQTGAIETSQLAQNVKEWGGVVQDVGSIAQSVQKQQAKDLKLQEEADEQMINTQIGSQAQTELLKWNVAQIEAGVDPNSDEYTQKLYAKKEELYQPYIDQMTSEKGRAFLQKQGLDTAERIRQANIGKISKNRQKAQAKAAFVDTAKNMGNDAREFGKINDWKGFKDSISEEYKAAKKYAKANNLPEYKIDEDNLLNFELGLAESDPELILRTYGTKEELRDIKSDEMKDMLEENANSSSFGSMFFKATDSVLNFFGIKSDDDLTKEEKDKVFDNWYEKENIKESSTQRKLGMLPEDAVKKISSSFVVSKKQEQLELKERMKSLPKSSGEYKTLQKAYDEIQEEIDNPESAVADMMTEDIRKSVLPIARQKYQENKLIEKKMKEDNVKDFYTMTLNPNNSVSFPAQMAAALGQPEVEELFQMSISNEEMHKAYDNFAKSKENVSKREYATFEATNAVSEKMYKFLSNPDNNDIVLMKDGFELLTEINKADLTQEQRQDLNNIMYGVFRDRGFADLAAAVFEDSNRYFADLPAINFVGGSMLAAGKEEAQQIGLPSENMRLIDKSSVSRFLDKESLRISKDAMAMLGKAAQLPTSQARQEAVNQVSNYIASEKRKVYDTAIQNYGVDVAKLRENKRLFGQAFTEIGFGNVVEFMGDDPTTGKPLFRAVNNLKDMSDARKRIIEGLEASKQQSKGKEQ